MSRSTTALGVGAGASSSSSRPGSGNTVTGGSSPSRLQFGSACTTPAPGEISGHLVGRPSQTPKKVGMLDPRWGTHRMAALTGPNSVYIMSFDLKGVVMSLAEQIRPITYLKSSAAEIVKEFAVNPEPIIITQNGEAKMVVMDIGEYEKQQETLALLKLLALGKKEFNEGKFSDAEAFLGEMDD
jgi:prevent-host-death family protein